MTPISSNSNFRRKALLLLLAIDLAASASAADLKQQTISAFHHYVALSEAKINSSFRGAQDDPRPFLWVDRLPASQRSAALAKLRTGGVVIQRLSTLDNGKPIPVPGGMIHHWIGSVFIPGATLALTLALVEDYDHHAEYYRPQVIASKILSRRSNDFRIYLRLTKRKFSLASWTRSTMFIMKSSIGRAPGAVPAPRTFARSPIGAKRMNTICPRDKTMDSSGA